MQSHNFCEGLRVLRDCSLFTEGLVLKRNVSEGAVIKYGTEGGGRDLTGSQKLLVGKCCANKLLQVINMGHEAICFRICCHIFTHVSNIVSFNFAVLLIIDHVLHLSF